MISNLVFLVLYIYMIVDLARSYGEYSDCVSPIHKWYMGWLSFVLIFHIMSMLLLMQRLSLFFVGIIGILAGPLSFLFMFIWNILGTVWTINIVASPDTAKCMSPGAIIGVVFLLLLVYIIYFFIFKYMIKICREKKNIIMKKKRIFVDLSEYYATLGSGEIGEVAMEKKVEMRDRLKSILAENLEIIKTTEMEEYEKAPMIYYFRGDGLGHVQVLDANKSSDNSGSLLLEEENTEITGIEIEMKSTEIGRSTRRQDTNENSDQNENNQNPSRDASQMHQQVSRIGVTQRIVTQQLFGIIGRDIEQEQHDQRMSLINENNDSNSGDCIICFCDLENLKESVALECSHRFHNECLFDWLKINPTCPMCRGPFRPELMNRMIKHLDSHICDTQQENA